MFSSVSELTTLTVKDGELKPKQVANSSSLGTEAAAEPPQPFIYGTKNINNKKRTIILLPDTKRHA